MRVAPAFFPAMIGLAFSFAAQAQEVRIAPSPEQPAMARRQMVAAANPLAAEAGLGALRDGGTAIDAAVAAQMVLSVVEPHASGIGGGALMLHWDAASAVLSGYDGIATAPAGAAEPLTRNPDGTTVDEKAIERTGRVVGVPGAVKMLALAHEKHGKLPWTRLLEPAARIAEDGFPMPLYLHRVLRARPAAARIPALRALFFETGTDRPLSPGSPVRNPEQAATLRMLAMQGPSALYGGAIGDAIVAAVASAPLAGHMTREDLAGYEAKRREPVCGRYFSRLICSVAPPSSGGIAVLQQLAILERTGIGRATPGSAETVHLFLEAGRLSLADRRRWVGDPDQVETPVAGLLDPTYLDGRAALIRPERAMEQAVAGDPPRRQGALPTEADQINVPATTHISIVDAAGNAVAFTTTNNLNFGADIVVGGFVLNNGLTNFATIAAVDGRPVANRMAPGKRPVTTMAPTIVFDAVGRPEIVIGAGGGARIIDAVAQGLVALLIWNQDVRTAVSQPHYGAQNRAIELEANTPVAALLPALEALGHKPKLVEMPTGLQAIRVTAAGLEGWADPRRDGVAVGD